MYLSSGNRTPNDDLCNWKWCEPRECETGIFLGTWRVWETLYMVKSNFSSYSNAPFLASFSAKVMVEHCDTGVVVVAMIFSQWNDPAPSSWWVSLTFGWCSALNELWIAHAVAFVRISITRCHPCRGKPRLVLFLLLLQPIVYFEWTRFIWIFFVEKGFSELNLGIWYKYLKKNGISFTTKLVHVQHAPVESRPGDYRPGIKRKE